MRQIIIGFGLMILCLLILFRIAEVSFIRGDVKLDAKRRTQAIEVAKRLKIIS